MRLEMKYLCQKKSVFSYVHFIWCVIPFTEFALRKETTQQLIVISLSYSANSPMYLADSKKKIF